MNFFKIGEIVTIKSHPLFGLTEDELPKRIKEFSAQVPPLMLIKEVLFEREEKKVVYSNEIKNAKIADLIKYVCVYFNANKSEFIEKVIYHSLLKKYSELKYYRKEEKNSDSSRIDLITEVKEYKKVSDYEFGKRVQFKTKKLEHRKSYEGNAFEKLHGVSFQTPDFILSGIKNQEQRDLFYPDGKTKKNVSEQLFKVMWFNHFQQKFSEDYLPKEFLVQNLDI